MPVPASPPRRRRDEPRRVDRRAVAHGGARREIAEGAAVSRGDRLPPTTVRVELHTAAATNHAIRRATNERVVRLADAPGARIDARLAELDAEWDIERALQFNASLIALGGVVLAAGTDRRFALLPVAVFGFLLRHALVGWCPPLPLMRRLGVRTRREIERECQALKAVRGDYDALPAPGSATPSARARAALAAIDA
ncbi:MAG: hypothetical protein MZW92_41885 [Comamonadaceae bacterium]|nr:hypothetical protein [Comamonadaceae bacterium]